MKVYPPRSPARHVRVPAFVPVPSRRRADGWTALRQAAFLVALARTGSVSQAAREVGMARETAYRLRSREGAGSFAAAWDRVMGREARQGKTGRAGKVTADERARRALDGMIKPMVFGGAFVGVAPKADNSALLGHLAQLDRGVAAGFANPERSQGFAARSASPSPPRRGGDESPPPQRQASR